MGCEGEEREIKTLKGSFSDVNLQWQFDRLSGVVEQLYAIAIWIAHFPPRITYFLIQIKKNCKYKDVGKIIR